MASSTSNTRRVGAGANCASAPAPSAPTPMPNSGATLFNSEPRSRCRSSMPALSALVAMPVATPWSGARGDQPADGVGMAEHQHGRELQHQRDDDHLAPAAVVGQRAEEQQRRQQRERVGREDQRQGQRREAPGLAVQRVQRRRRGGRGQIGDQDGRLQPQRGRARSCGRGAGRSRPAGGLAVRVMRTPVQLTQSLCVCALCTPVAR